MSSLMVSKQLQIHSFNAICLISCHYIYWLKRARSRKHTQLVRKQQQLLYFTTDNS
jgi:hypothetical protein